MAGASANNTIIRYSERNTDSNRRLLADALESTAETKGERALLSEYKELIGKFEAKQAELDGVNSALSKLYSQKGNKKGSTQFMHYLYTPVSINGAPFLAKLTVEEYDVDGKTRAYNLRRIEMPELSRAQFSSLIAGNRGKFAYNSDALSVAQLFDFVKQYDKEFKPIDNP